MSAFDLALLLCTVPCLVNGVCGLLWPSPRKCDLLLAQYRADLEALVDQVRVCR